MNDTGNGQAVQQPQAPTQVDASSSASTFRENHNTGFPGTEITNLQVPLPAANDAGVGWGQGPAEATAQASEVPLGWPPHPSPPAALAPSQLLSPSLLQLQQQETDALAALLRHSQLWPSAFGRPNDCSIALAFTVPEAADVARAAETVYVNHGRLPDDVGELRHLLEQAIQARYADQSLALATKWPAINEMMTNCLSPNMNVPGAAEAGAMLAGFLQGRLLPQLPFTMPGTNLIPLRKRLRIAIDWIDAIQLGGEQADWPDPEPIVRATPALFPLDALPTQYRAWAIAVSQGLQLPVDLPAIMGLGVVSAAAAKYVKVRNDTWREPGNIFGVVAMGPSNRKTAAVAEACRPLMQYEIDENTRLERRIHADSDRIENLEAQRAEVMKAAKRPNISEADRQDLLRRATDLAMSVQRERQTQQHKRQLLVADCTTEKLGPIMAEQGGRIASISSEGTLFDLMAGRYSNKPNFDLFLAGYSTVEPYRTDRVNRESVYIPEPVITLAISPQPSVVESLARNREMIGRGLLSRFLFSYPESWLGHRDPTPPPIPPEVSDTYRAMIRMVCELDHTALTQARELVLSPEARSRLIQFQRDVETRLDPHVCTEVMQGWGGKICGNVMRLAGLLHLIAMAEQEIGREPVPPEQPPSAESRRRYAPERERISDQTMYRALLLGTYFWSHAERIFGLSRSGNESNVLADACRVLQWIWRGNRRVFRWSQVRDDLRHIPREDENREIVDLLETRGIVRVKDDQGARHPAGGRRGDIHANPKIFEDRFQQQSRPTRTLLCQ